MVGLALPILERHAVAGLATVVKTAKERIIFAAIFPQCCPGTHCRSPSFAPPKLRARDGSLHIHCISLDVTRSVSSSRRRRIDMWVKGRIKVTYIVKPN